MKRLAGVWLILLLLVAVAHAQTLLTTSPPFFGTSQPLALRASQFNEFNVTLTNNTPIIFDVPIITGTLTFRLNLCENSVGGWIPSFTAVQTSVAIVNRVGTNIASTAANYCETQNWSYRSQQNQLVLETNSPTSAATGGIPGVTVTNTPTSTNQTLNSTSNTMAAWGSPASALPGVTVTNSPSSSSQTLNSTGTSTAAWGTPPGGLPAFGNPGFALYQNAGGTAAQWVACAGDLICSAITPGSYTVTKIQGNKVLAGVPGGDAYFYVWNQAQAQFVAVPASGDVAMSNTGRFTVSKVNGASVGPLATQQVPCTVAQGCTGTTATQTGILRGGSPILGTELSGDATTSGTNAVTVVGTHLSSALPTAQGGTGTASPGETAGTGLSVSGSFPTQQFSLLTPVTVALGGTQCGTPTTVSGLPGSPTQGQRCSVTDDISGCVAGTPVSGSGSGKCSVTWCGSSWLPGDCVTSSASGGVTAVNATSPITSTGGTTPTVSLGLVPANLGGTGADLSALSGILRAGNPITSSIVRATDTDNTIAHTGVDINTSHQVTNTHLANALPYAQGGLGCNATTFAALPVSPAGFPTCIITDANSCAVGSTISSGGGVTIPECTIRWNGTNWIASDVIATNPLTIGVPVTASNGITTSVVNNSSPNPATSGLINDINNNETLAAADAANDGNDIDEVGTDSANQVHIGGGGATTVTFDNPSTVSQGSFSSGSYLDAAVSNLNFMGGTDSCSQNVHNYVLTSNSTITVSCMGQNNQRLTYYIQQPSSGSTFTYAFAANAGAAILGDVPTACNLNGCIDEVTVDWIPSMNEYIVNLVKSNITGGTTAATTCPAGQTCYYFATPSDPQTPGNDSNPCSFALPCATISRAQAMLKNPNPLNPGDEILFKGGDTWVGTGDQAGSLNPSFLLGDTSAHAVNGSSAKPILITTYGNGFNAIIDAANLNNFCIAANSPVQANSVSFITVSKFDCTRALQAGIYFKNGGGYAIPFFQGITLANNNIYDTGPGCSAHNNAACMGQDSPDWNNGTTYTPDNSIRPCLPVSNVCTVNAGGYNYHETVASCTSGGSSPTWNQTPFGTATTDGTCSWVNTGITTAGYKNQLQVESDNASGTPMGTRMLNNKVKWGGGHNLLEIHQDTGQWLAQGNVVGPGCVHNCFDVKNPGNANAGGTTTETIGGTIKLNGNVAQVLQNVSTPGYSQGLDDGSDAFFVQNTENSTTSDILFQLNTAYDFGHYANGVHGCGSASGCSGTCFHTTPNGSGCTGGNACAIVARIYNNTCYQSNTGGGSFGVFAGNGAGSGVIGNSTIDLRNNIFDGFVTDSVAVNSNAVVASNATAGSISTEDYNDIGGSVGSPGYYFRTNAVQNPGSRGTHDLYSTSSGTAGVDPLYICEQSSSCGTFTSLPNYSLQTGSPAINAGTSSVTTGHSNMGAY